MNLHHSVQYMSLACLLFISACATTPQLSRQDVLQQNDTVAELDKRLASAEKNDAEYLAPEGFQQASSYLEQAVSAAQEGNMEDATADARKGLQALSSVEKDIATSRNLFVEVIANRDRAIKAGAPQLFTEEFTKLETDLRSTTSLVEDNKIEKAKKRRPGLITRYGQLELKSVKKGAVHSARAAIADAQEKGADDYAPKTFKHAQEELTLALSILEANRNQSEKASVHTNRAIELARQSVQITELINDFDRRDYSEEDKILWYQSQLTTIYSPLNKRLVFDQDNRATVEAMRDDIASLTNLTQKHKQEIRKQSKQREALEKRERETRQRFEYVQSLFNEKEADVYRKREDVLVLAHGFYFEPGQSEIKSVNFSLLNKIDQARRKFPGSKLVISGHTDATGNAKKNKILSQKRAANVAKFLQETKGVNPSAVTVRGYGAEKPVAPNSTREGRSRNRRIEVLIDNSSRS
ncbi:MAG: OmpA family protein [Gammaproteobacteria bacterium]|nr:OmpA family protein [Gammaproteobacteria bacterium]